MLWQLHTIFHHMQWLVLQREREPVQLHMSGLWLQELHLHVHHPHMQAHSLALRLHILGMSVPALAVHLQEAIERT